MNCCQLSGFAFPSLRFRNPIQHLNLRQAQFLLCRLDIVYFHNVQIIYVRISNIPGFRKIQQTVLSQWIEVEEANDASHELLGALDP